MAEKYDTILRLAEETVKNVSAGEEEWYRFMDFAGRFIKYPFRDQVLIYAQRPDSRACAPMKTWDSMGCWVRRGSRGIALIDTAASRPKLKYVFDMADVTPEKEKNGHLPELWSVKPEHEQAVMEALEAVYGKTDAQYPFRDRIVELVMEAAKGRYEKAAERLAGHLEGSFLNGMEKRKLQLTVFGTLMESAVCAVISACGIGHHPAGYRFWDIRKFNTPETLHIIGDEVNALVRPVVAEIGRTVREYEKQKETDKGGRGHAEEKNTSAVQKSLASAPEREYNALKRESGTQETGKKDTDKEGGSGYGAEIQTGRGLPGTRPRNGQTAGRGAEEVRPDAEKIPDGKQRSGVHDTPVREYADEPPVHAAGAGRRADGPDHGTDGSGNRSKRGAQGTGPDAVGQKNEQHPAGGGGNRPGGNDLHLSTDNQAKIKEKEKEPDNGQPPLSGSFQQKQQDGTEGTYEQLGLFSMLSEQVGAENQKTPEEPDTQPGQKPGAGAEPELDQGRAPAGNVVQAVIQPDADSPASDAGMQPAHNDKGWKNSGQTGFDLEKAKNYRITDDGLGTGGRKEKFQRNVTAIRTLEKIENENRPATPEEQGILAQYVGWGGLADAFDEGKSVWAGEYRELKSLLSPDEYASARESTLNAHYTSPVVARSIYGVLERMGFEKGSILEPSMGTGNFFGMLPEKMRRSRLYGVELDGITGRIAKQLYPGADIKITGFEKTSYPNDFFDIAVGNVPFGQYRVPDRKYDKLGFPVHEYFFAKALDQVRPGGVIAFVTSRWVMDKKTTEARKYLAQRAELLGAVRLPNNAFKDNAGTEVTADILFFQKLDRMAVREPEWVQVSENGDGISMNQYFVEHPEMVVGRMEMVSGPYGMESTCQPYTSRPFEEQLKEAVSHISGSISMMELPDMEAAAAGLPADPGVKNYSYTVVDGGVYYRENSIMTPADVPETTGKRIKGMVQIRDCTQELIRLQMEECPDSAIKEKQAELNTLYDNFTKAFGLLNSSGNKRAFSQDASYCLLCSLEKLDDEGDFKGKADMFFKRTIKRAEPVTSVDNAAEALAVSLSEKAGIDLEYMAALCGKDAGEVTKELSGVIFQNPVTGAWETAGEYLSGNVREKLKTAEIYAENRPEYAVNAQALRQVQPKELEAGEIDVRIGATWIGPRYIDDFMRETLQTPGYMIDNGRIKTRFSSITGKWGIDGKSADSGNVAAGVSYGTGRVDAYKILEDSLNLKDVRVYDTVTDEEGREKRVLNKKETMLAAQKQEALREAFRSWVFEEPQRRQELCGKYNRLFNSTRPREYDGSHLKFPGMTPDIELRPHQLNAIAHQLYGANTLLAHCVGAGKTFEMIAAAMESRRLGISQKCMFVVPNHLTGQWAADFLRLYPGANILAATKKDFEASNRKKFCSRIATGEYDAVIIGHSQFAMIPLSAERQAAVIERQIDEIEASIKEAKAEKGERYTIKQMEATKKSLYARLERMNDAERKDNVVTFEQLGVDRLFVDESHNFKNLFLYTKMRNVAGIAQSEAQKSSDMFAKCQYMDDVICCEL